MKRAVLYARVSGDDRNNATSSIEGQLADCRAYAVERGYTMVGEYFEEPNKQTSGADWLPELDRILQLAPGKGFDVLVCRDVSRLARNRFKQLSTEIALQSYGVTVEYAVGRYEDSPEGRSLKGLVSEFAEYERERIRTLTHNGRLRSVAAGNVLVGHRPPYGYRVESVDGKRTLVISEQEASIVRTIFDLYVNNLYSLQRICDYLDSYEVPRPTGRSGAWSVGTVRNILINEAYTGKWRYRKTKRVTKTRTQARPPEEWLEAAIPAVVSEELFAAVQLRREANKREQGRQRRRDYALAGMLTCAHCGKAVVGIARQERRFYVCGARRDSVKRYGFRCNSGWTPAQDLEAAVWGWIRSLLLEPEKLRQAIEDYQTQQQEQIQPLLAMLESNQMRLNELEKEKARLIGACAKGVLSLDELAVQKTGLDKAIADLGQAIAMLRAEAEPNLPSAERIETIEAVAAELRDTLHQADNDLKKQREIYQLLTVQVTVRHENEQRWVTASCDLGNARLSLEYTTTAGMNGSLRRSWMRQARPLPLSPALSTAKSCPSGSAGLIAPRPNISIWG